MLFGMFFGAGNLIFPASMGQMAGRSVWLAGAGFLITGVGLPLMGVAALGVSRAEGLLKLSSRVGRGYGLFFTCLLPLAIGPFFAIPRCATVSYTVGVQQLLPDLEPRIALGLFTFVFLAGAVFLPAAGELLTWIGKVLDLLAALPRNVLAALPLEPLLQLRGLLPLADKGFGWVLPALAGLALGLVLNRLVPNKSQR